MRRTLTLAAAPGSSVYLHMDTFGMATWELQLRGQTRWVVCKGGDGSVVAECGLAAINVFDPDYSTCPAFRNATCYETTLSAGESIFVMSCPSPGCLASFPLSEAWDDLSLLMKMRSDLNDLCHHLCCQVPNGWWMAQSAVTSGAAWFGMKVMLDLELPAIATGMLSLACTPALTNPMRGEARHAMW